MLKLKYSKYVEAKGSKTLKQQLTAKINRMAAKTQKQHKNREQQLNKAKCVKA